MYIGPPLVYIGGDRSGYTPGQNVVGVDLGGTGRGIHQGEAAQHIHQGRDIHQKLFTKSCGFHRRRAVEASHSFSADVREEGIIIRP